MKKVTQIYFEEESSWPTYVMEDGSILKPFFDYRGIPYWMTETEKDQINDKIKSASLPENRLWRQIKDIFK